LTIQKELTTKSLTETPDKINKNIGIQEKKHKICSQSNRVFKSKLEQMEIANNNHEQ
jgi:hypothetical protein